MSTTNEIRKQLKENTANNQLDCTKSELDEYLCYGFLLQTSDNNYRLLDGTSITVNVVKDKNYRMTIDLSGLLKDSEEKLKNSKTNKIYYMTTRCYNIYKENGLILEQKDNSYYRLFNNELWLVSII